MPSSFPVFLVPFVLYGLFLMILFDAFVPGRPSCFLGIPFQLLVVLIVEFLPFSWGFARELSIAPAVSLPGLGLICPCRLYSANKALVFLCFLASQLISPQQGDLRLLLLLLMCWYPRRILGLFEDRLVLRKSIHCVPHQHLVLIPEDILLMIRQGNFIKLRPICLELSHIHVIKPHRHGNLAFPFAFFLDLL